jgi:3-oxoacyl-(acyl-carrier-protein) synthase
MNGIYIRSTGAISPQLSFSQLVDRPADYAGDRLTCIEPDYATIIDAKMIRRMSRIIKIGTAAAMDCLKGTGVQQPGAIITGTAYGCLADTDLFLAKMVENREELLTPTAFIQSTHNTVGAQIALLLKCHNYNNTFVHRGFSFESSLLDAITFSRDEQANDVLVGAVDEITDTSHAILSRFGFYRKGSLSSLDLLSGGSKGTLAGEGAAFFLLNRQPSGNDYAELNAIHTFYKPQTTAVINREIQSFLAAASIQMEDIGLIITGKNGDTKNDRIYGELQTSLFAGKAQIGYKHLCGEYPTSSAFACWLAANILKFRMVPGSRNAEGSGQKLKTILIYNHYQHIHHSLYLLSAC